MHIQLEHVHKRFLNDWIIKDLSFSFEKGQIYGIKGRNGSGKSTLLKIISSALQPSKGKITYKSGGKIIEQSAVYQHLSSYSAGDEMIEEYNSVELYEHRSRFKKLNIKKKRFFDDLELNQHHSKPINTFSSGMKQRLALGLTLHTEASLYLFDEPSSYLDESKKAWFNEKLDSIDFSESIVIIASNEANDFHKCGKMIEMDSLI